MGWLERRVHLVHTALGVCERLDREHGRALVRRGRAGTLLHRSTFLSRGRGLGESFLTAAHSVRVGGGALRESRLGQVLARRRVHDVQPHHRVDDVGLVRQRPRRDERDLDDLLRARRRAARRRQSRKRARLKGGRATETRRAQNLRERERPREI